MYLHKLPYKIKALMLNKASITNQKLASNYVCVIGSKGM